ncbi:unnamed protein product [Owenia fusiformis]|uniref:Uncharacterized protein n=1 Tax=Owenia fusiformis TaxID=6347 RepID=A0A8S4PFK2_OWEFU|nr:unnamed protein product [Owenia fusiformis]
MLRLNFFHMLCNTRYILTICIMHPRKLSKLIFILTFILFIHFFIKVQYSKGQQGPISSNSYELTSEKVNNLGYTTLQTGQKQNKLNILNTFLKETEYIKKERDTNIKMPHSGGFITLPINLISMDVMDNGQVGLQLGWWILQPESWSLQIDCNSDTTCHKSIDLNATPGVLYTVFQFIAFHQTAPIKGIYFSVKTSSDAKTWDEHAVNHHEASAMIRFTDASSQVLHLNFQLITSQLVQSNVSYIFPIGGATVSSVTVMLGVKGLVGKVRFRDIEIKPIIQLQQEHNHDLTQFHFITTCPDVLSPLRNASTFIKNHFVLNDNGFETMESVTMVTQLSLDRWKSWTTRILPEWKGPVSVALYVPNEEKNQDIKPANIAETLKNFKYCCAVTVVYGAYQHEKYPINHLRNLAMEQVRTEYMLLVDADFYISPNFIESFQLSIINESSPINAYVIPAFEYSHGQNMEPLAKSKKELVTLLHQPRASIQPFRRHESEKSHKSTDYQRWYTSSTLYPIRDYQMAYEPYLVLKTSTKKELKYDERFDGYGMNKISFIMELIAAGYNFKVLPYCWATHLPHHSSSHSLTFLTDLSENLRNRVKRFEFISDLTKRYKLGGCETS